MQIGMVGLGRMGANMARRLVKGGHSCVVHDRSASAVDALVAEGMTGARTPQELVAALTPPRVVCLMLPVAVVDAALDTLVPLLAKGDTVIDGGNSLYHDDIARAERLRPKGVHYVDMGTSGGVLGLERGYCLMLGGERDVIDQLTPMFEALAPGAGSVPRTPGRTGTVSGAEHGYLHCGPAGAGHFVKMVHNGIEYGLMAAYAEGFSILQHANTGRTARGADAETTPLRHPEHFQYEFDLMAISEVWRRGSVIASWLLDLTAAAFAKDPRLEGFAGRVADSGEGRWTVEAAIEAGVPAQVLASALFARFTSRGEDDFQSRVLSAMRLGFGGHTEKR